jgi:hypothetical protein
VGGNVSCAGGSITKGSDGTLTLKPNAGQKVSVTTDLEVAGGVGAASIWLPQGNNIGTDAYNNIILNSIAGYAFPNATINCNSLTATGDITAGGNVNAPKGNLYVAGGNIGTGSDGGLIINPNGGKVVSVNSSLFVNGYATTQDGIFFPGGSLNKAPSGGAQLNSTGGIVLNNDTTVNGALTHTG